VTPDPSRDGATLPVDPMSALAEAATSLHELFVSYCRGGFTQDQSMQLIVAIVQQAMRQPPPEDT
jgi:hypothetical protein